MKKTRRTPTTPVRIQAFRLFLAAFSLSVAQPFSLFSGAATLFSANFEKGVPRDLVIEGVEVATDTTRARSGRSSLRVTPKTGANYNIIRYELDGRVNFSSSYEFSFWVYVEEKTSFTAYISSHDGSERYTLTDAKGKIEPGKWCEFKGAVHAGDWRRDDQTYRLILRTNRTCWVDDITFDSIRAESPAQIWPKLESSLQNAANKRISPLKPGESLALDARNAVLAPDTARAETSLPSDASAVIPAEGVLVFAIDAKDDLELTGSLQVEPDADLRPGLRLTVLSGNTVIAAPGVKAAPWKGTSDGNRPGPAPDIRGERPPAAIPLTGWRMAKGRNYITIAGPHIRPGGTFAKLELRATDRPAANPLYTFGLFSDTHLGFGRTNWMNVKLNARAGGELEAALRQLKREDSSAFAIIAGDMTDNGRRSQFEELARVAKRANLPVYGCIGNHDTFRNSRADIAATVPKFFPDGPDKTDYAFDRPPLRFIVLDGSHWRGKDGTVRGYRTNNADQTTYREDLRDWLRDTLAADASTPTFVISHYPFYLPRGVSPVTGYDLGKTPSMDKMLMTALDTAPNVVATANGHLHYNMAGARNGITSLQNPAFVEWPNAYRVFRVYPDRVEWEVRQMPNRGLIREGVRPEMALLWMLSLTDDDLAGTINLARRPARPPVETIVNDSFEGVRVPANGPSSYRVNTAIDTARAHSGSASLRVTPTAEWGTVAYELDNIMDFAAGAELSVWVYAEKPGIRITSYISAQADDAKDRHSVVNLTGTIKPGEWIRLTAKVPAGKWRMDEREVRFIVRAYGPCWIDDASVKAVRE